MTSGHVGARESPGSQGFHPTSLATLEKGKHLFPSSSSTTPTIECHWTGLGHQPSPDPCDQDGRRSGPCLEPTLGILGGVGITWIWSVGEMTSKSKLGCSYHGGLAAQLQQWRQCAMGGTGGIWPSPRFFFSLFTFSDSDATLSPPEESIVPHVWDRAQKRYFY